MTRKKTRAVSIRALGLHDKLYLGNLDSKRDWGHAKDYVRMMWMILQAEKAEDWVIATGRTTSVRDFVRLAFRYIGIDLKFEGQGVNEVGVVDCCNNTSYNIPEGKVVVAVNPRYFRSTEVDLLIGNSKKAFEKLGWKPKYTLEDLVSEMMENDLKIVQNGLR